MRLILQFLIISIGCIKRCRRIMSEYPVLRYHRSGDRLGIFIKQAVVSHTQSDDNVQVRLRMVQHLRLKDRVAHIDSDLVAALRNPNVRFGRGACLTGNPEYCKAALAEDRRQSPALLQEPHAGSDADLLRPDSLRESHDLLNPCILAVMVTFHLCRRNRSEEHTSELQSPS